MMFANRCVPMETSSRLPSSNSDFSLEQDLDATVTQNVFVMMRFREEDDQFREIESTIRRGIHEFGLCARLAKDRAYRPDLWDNIVYYMRRCRYGIAVFEQINELQDSPNVAMELGYMYARRRPCLLLKDSRMEHLPVDIGGKIYKDFDRHKIRESVTRSIVEWCKEDLALDSIPRTDLDRAIDTNIGRYHFDKPSRWANRHLLVLQDEWQDMKRYIVWDPDQRKLLKYYREFTLGKSWDGPYPLSDADQQRIKAHLRIDL